MRLWPRLFNQIMQLFRRKSRPEDIPKKLDAEALQRAMEEARLLHARHAVDVKTLSPDEEPGAPKRADSAD